MAHSSTEHICGAVLRRRKQESIDECLLASRAAAAMRLRMSIWLTLLGFCYWLLNTELVHVLLCEHILTSELLLLNSYFSVHCYHKFRLHFPCPHDNRPRRSSTHLVVLDTRDGRSIAYEYLSHPDWDHDLASSTPNAGARSPWALVILLAMVLYVCGTQSDSVISPGSKASSFHYPFDPWVLHLQLPRTGAVILSLTSLFCQ